MHLVLAQSAFSEALMRSKRWTGRHLRGPGRRGDNSWEASMRQHWTHPKDLTGPSQGHWELGKFCPVLQMANWSYGWAKQPSHDGGFRGTQCNLIMDSCSFLCSMQSPIDTHTETHTHYRHTQTHTQTYTQRHTDTQRQRQRHIHRDTDTHTYTDT